MWPKFPNISLTVEGKPRKNLNQETGPAGDLTRVRCVKSNDDVEEDESNSFLRNKGSGIRKNMNYLTTGRR